MKRFIYEDITLAGAVSRDVSAKKWQYDLNSVSVNLKPRATLC
jgi:hypothetical protein